MNWNDSLLSNQENGPYLTHKRLQSSQHRCDNTSKTFLFKISIFCCLFDANVYCTGNIVLISVVKRRAHVFNNHESMSNKSST